MAASIQALSGTILMTAMFCIASDCFADTPLFVYTRDVVTLGDHPNAQNEPLTKYFESGVILQRGTGDKKRIVLYLDRYGTYNFGEKLKPLEDRKLVGTDLLVDERNGFLLPYVANQKGPNSNTDLPLLFSVPSSLLQQHDDTIAFSLDFKVHSSVCQIKGLLRSESKDSEITIKGPVAGTAEIGEIAVGGTIERRLAASDSRLLESREDCVYAVNKDLFIKSIGDYKPDEARRILADSQIVLTKVEAVAQAANEKGNKELALTKPITDFLSQLKQDQDK